MSFVACGAVAPLKHHSKNTSFVVHFAVCTIRLAWMLWHDFNDVEKMAQNGVLKTHLAYYIHGANTRDEMLFSEASCCKQIPCFSSNFSRTFHMSSTSMSLHRKLSVARNELCCNLWVGDITVSLCFWRHALAIKWQKCHVTMTRSLYTHNLMASGHLMIIWCLLRHKCLALWSFDEMSGCFMVFACFRIQLYFDVVPVK